MVVVRDVQIKQVLVTRSGGLQRCLILGSLGFRLGHLRLHLLTAVHNHLLLRLHGCQRLIVRGTEHVSTANNATQQPDTHDTMREEKVKETQKRRKHERKNKQNKLHQNTGKGKHA